MSRRACEAASLACICASYVSSANAGEGTPTPRVHVPASASTRAIRFISHLIWFLTFAAKMIRARVGFLSVRRNSNKRTSEQANFIRRSNGRAYAHPVPCGAVMIRRITPAIAAFCAGAEVFVILRSRRLRTGPVDGHAAPDLRHSVVDEAGLESFPASDQPSWTLGEERMDS